MKFEAVVRTELGKGASRRLRHAGKFPAVVYGGEEAAVAIVLNHDDIVNQMDKPEFYEGIVLVIDGKEVKVNVVPLIAEVDLSSDIKLCNVLTKSSKYLLSIFSGGSGNLGAGLSVCAIIFSHLVLDLF